MILKLYIHAWDKSRATAGCYNDVNSCSCKLTKPAAAER